MKKYFLCFGAGVYQEYLVKKIKKIGFKTISVDKSRFAPALSRTDIKIIQSVNEVKKIKKRLTKLNLTSKIVGVLTQAARDSTVSVAIFSKILGLRSLNLKTTKLVLLKHKMGLKFNKDLNSKLYNYNEIDKIKNNFPYVVKFLGKSGGNGNFYINSRKDLDRIKKKIKKEKNIYIEDFVKGRHFSIAGIRNGKKTKFICLIEKKINNNFSNDLIFYQPDLDNFKRKAYKYCKEVLNKINFDYGPFHFEFIFFNNQFFLAEIEPSLIGSYISEIMIPKITNTCLIDDTISLTLGNEINYKLKSKKKYSLLKFFYSEKKFKKFFINKPKIMDNIIIKQHDVSVKKKGLASNVVYFETNVKKNFDIIKKKLESKYE